MVLTKNPREQPYIPDPNLLYAKTISNPQNDLRIALAYEHWLGMGESWSGNEVRMRSGDPGPDRPLAVFTKART